MSDFQWSQTKFEERWFHVLAFLLSRKRQQQDPDSNSDHETESKNPLEEEDSAEDANIRPRDIAKEEGKKTLLKKFLDRFAEVMAHYVDDKKGDDVCATGMLEFEDHAKAYIAKNGGINDDDLKMMRLLQTWLRTVPTLGVRPDIKKDTTWKEMVIWSKPRLLFYRDTLTNIFQGTKITWPTSKEILRVEHKLSLVHDFCTTRSGHVDPSVEEWTEIITICYELRYESYLQSYLEDCYEKMGIPGKTSSLSTALAYLGRLRTAYETFIEFSMQFPFAKTINIEKISMASVEPFEPFNPGELSNRLTSDGINLKNLKLREGGKLVKQKSEKLKLINQNLQGAAVRVHAEIQVLMKLLGSRVLDGSVVGEVNYIGCSKKSCYLCFRLLDGFYQVRDSHRQIWPRWTIPPTQNLDPSACDKIRARVSNIGNCMLQQLRGKTDPPLQMKAHSTPAVTEVSFSKTPRTNRRLLDHEISRHSIPRESITQEPKLGDVQQEIRALLIPADGSELRLVTIPIRSAFKAYQAQDSFLHNVPDFQKFWPAGLNFDRGFHRWDSAWKAGDQELVNQEYGNLNGQYIIYYNQSEELGPNEFVKRILQIDELPSHETFWNGDIFVIKRMTRMVRKKFNYLNGNDSDDDMIEVDYDDDSGAALYDDVPDQILHSNLCFQMFKAWWEQREPEQRLNEDRDFGEIELQHTIDKDLILARMTETELEELNHLPIPLPGFIEMLAMGAVDNDGTLMVPRVTKDPSLPGKVIVESHRKISTLEKMDWQGFSSDQL